MKLVDYDKLIEEIRKIFDKEIDKDIIGLNSIHLA